MERRTDLALEAAEQPVRQEALTDEDMERDRFVQGRAAVSYTHLDVYKRQLLPWPV